MHKPQAQVREFHLAVDQPAPDSPTLDNYPYDLRIRLIAEEFDEFVDACGYELEVFHQFPEDGACIHCGISLIGSAACKPRYVKVRSANWVEMIDALGDLLYVVFGAFVSMGVDAEPVFDEIQRSNMTKLWEDGKAHKNALGKILKPPLWSPPDLKSVLDWLMKP